MRPLGAPALHDKADKLLVCRRKLGHRDKEIVRRLMLVVAPLDQERRLLIFANLDAHARELRSHGAS